MIAVSDTTPIISLLKVGQLELLQKLYKTVLVPQAVYRELTENPAYINEADIIKNADYLLMDEQKGRRLLNASMSDISEQQVS